MEIAKIKYELKDFKSNRKATLKLLSLVSGANIIMGNHVLVYDGLYVHENKKAPQIGGYCCVCKNICCYARTLTHINENKIRYNSCTNCKNKTLCSGCLRESSRCSLIHSRKLLCWQILLSQKFPKDLIKLITKKVK